MAHINQHNHGLSRLLLLPRRLTHATRKLGKRRIALITISILLVLWIGFFIALRVQRSAHIKTLESVRSALQQDMEAITSLPAPTAIEKGQIDSALGYIINNSREMETKKLPDLPPDWQLSAQKPSNAHWKSDVTQLKKIQELEDQSDRLLSHHALALETVGQILRYNPQADLSSPSLSNDEVNARITAAHDGIGRVQTELGKLQPYSSADDIKALRAAVETLQADLQVFNQTRNKDAWYAAVNSSQDKILANRQSFWTIERDKLLTTYAETNQLLSTVITNL